MIVADIAAEEFASVCGGGPEQWLDHMHSMLSEAPVELQILLKSDATNYSPERISELRDLFRRLIFATIKDMPKPEPNDETPGFAG